MSPAKHISGARCAAAFTLIEMMAVIAIMVALMTASIHLLKDTGAQSRRSGTDLLAGLIEQARIAAITSRSDVVLAIAEPGDLPLGDERCRIGIFKVKEWPTEATGPVVALGTGECTILSRWQTLNTGIVLLGGRVAGMESVENPLDQAAQASITYPGNNKNITVQTHIIAFNSRGGLRYPTGSSSIVFRIAEGGYRDGAPKANLRKGQTTPTENLLKVGRVTARPYRIDG